MKKYDITVFIPTYFGEDYLDDLLKMVFRQKIDKTFEVLIYDTSSADGTPAIIEKYTQKYKNLRHKTITKQEYGHGKTRAAAAHDARGDIVVYLSQDATPAHKYWLYEMVKPFEISDRIIGVMGKQDPRPKTFPLLKREVMSVFGSFGPDCGTTIFYKDSFIKKRDVYDKVAFYSDVNSAARRSYLVGELPYKDVAYAEDQLFGRDVIEAGYMKAYAPRGNVLHSNEFKLREYKLRMFDETMGLRKVGIDVPLPSRKRVLKMVVIGWAKDTVFTLRDKDYSLKRRMFYLVANIFYNIEKWRGVRKAVLADIDDKASIGKCSLEEVRAKSVE